MNKSIRSFALIAALSMAAASHAQLVGGSHNGSYNGGDGGQGGHGGHGGQGGTGGQGGVGLGGNGGTGLGVGVGVGVGVGQGGNAQGGNASATGGNATGGSVLGSGNSSSSSGVIGSGNSANANTNIIGGATNNNTLGQQQGQQQGQGQQQSANNTQGQNQSSNSVSQGGAGGAGGNASIGNTSSNSNSSSNSGGNTMTGGSQATSQANSTNVNVQGDTVNYEAQKRNPVASAWAAPLAAGAVTCLGSASGGAQTVGFGFSFGTTKLDEGCDRRANAASLSALGMTEVAVALMCQDSNVAAAMKAAGKSCTPANVASVAPAAVAVAPVLAAPGVDVVAYTPTTVTAGRTRLVRLDNGFTTN